MISRRSILAAPALILPTRALAIPARRGIVAPDPLSATYALGLDPAVHPISGFTPNPTTAIIVCNGQSNMAQYTNYTYTATSAANMYEYLPGDNTLRNWVEPVFGAGTPPLIGQWFGQLGDALLSNPAFKIGGARVTDIIWCFTAIGGTLASQWGPQGGVTVANGLTGAQNGLSYFSMYTSLYFRLRQRGWSPTMFIDGQGETESFYSLPGTCWTPYWLANVSYVQTNFGFLAPWFFAKETWNAGVTNASVQAAQVAIANGVSIFNGPNLDVYGNAFRYDDTHLNSTGGAAWAGEWNAIIAAHTF